MRKCPCKATSLVHLRHYPPPSHLSDDSINRGGKMISADQVGIILLYRDVQSNGYNGWIDQKLVASDIYLVGVRRA